MKLDAFKTGKKLISRIIKDEIEVTAIECYAEAQIKEEQVLFQYCQSILMDVYDAAFVVIEPGIPLQYIVEDQVQEMITPTHMEIESNQPL